MTIIAFKDGVMAADGACWNGGRECAVPFPKITRGSDGSLWALTGKMTDGWFLREWVIAGMNMEVPPLITGTDDDTPSMMLAKPDGTLWSARGMFRFARASEWGCWGENDAATFCEGAMAAGLSAAEAVALTIRHHQWAGGDVQVERLSR